MLDKEAALNTVKQYAEIVRREFFPAAVVMFGSYVNGTPHEYSDIDVGIIFDGFNGNRYEAATRLWHLSSEINLNIEPHLLDIKKDKSGFAQHVLKTGQIIYKQ